MGSVIPGGHSDGQDGLSPSSGMPGGPYPRSEEEAAQDWQQAWSRAQHFKVMESEEAEHWYDVVEALASSAAETGDGYAMEVLGYLAQTRSFDSDRAVYWARRAAEKGRVGAMAALPSLLRASSSERSPEWQEALEWEEKAIAHGSSLAMASRAALLEQIDPAAALKLYRTAAALGQVQSMTNAGRLEYRAGNVEQAIQLWTQAAKGGSVLAMINLAWELESTDSEMALFWLRQAAELGDDRAKIALKRLQAPWRRNPVSRYLVRQIRRTMRRKGWRYT